MNLSSTEILCNLSHLLRWRSRCGILEHTCCDFGVVGDVQKTEQQKSQSPVNSESNQGKSQKINKSDINYCQQVREQGNFQSNQ